MNYHNNVTFCHKNMLNHVVSTFSDFLWRQRGHRLIWLVRVVAFCLLLCPPKSYSPNPTLEQKVKHELYYNMLPHVVRSGVTTEGGFNFLRAESSSTLRLLTRQIVVLHLDGFICWVIHLCVLQLVSRRKPAADMNEWRWLLFVAGLTLPKCASQRCFVSWNVNPFLSLNLTSSWTREMLVNRTLLLRFWSRCK